MKKFLAGGAVAAALASAPAFAADMPVKAPIYRAAPEFSWSGCYIGGHVGYIRSGYEDEFSAVIDYDGVIGGVLGGCNWQFPSRWVIGIEADNGWASTQIDSRNTPAVISSELNWLATVRGRVGYAWDRVLVYGTAGAAFASQTFTNPAFGEDTQTHDGWVAGAGLEMALVSNWTARIEYLHFDVGNKTYNIGLGGFNASVQPGDIVRVGLTYKFGG